MFHQKNRCYYMQIQKLGLLSYHTKHSMFDRTFQQDRHLHWQDACTVCMFCHSEIQLLPHARRIIHHCDRTRHGNSAFPFHFVFRIGSCIFSFGAHISSWSRTRDTTLIRGLDHGWNRTFIRSYNRPEYDPHVNDRPCAEAQRESIGGVPNKKKNRRAVLSQCRKQPAFVSRRRKRFVRYNIWVLLIHFHSEDPLCPVLPTICSFEGLKNRSAFICMTRLQPEQHNNCTIPVIHSSHIALA